MSVDISKLDFKLRDELNGYLEELVREGGSDLHIKSNSVIRKRIHGEMVPVSSSRFLSTQEGLTLAKELLRGRFNDLVENKSADFIHKLNEDYRFRVNIFFQMDGVSAAFRAIPVKLPVLEDLGLPESVAKLCDTVYRGIVLITGPTGSGKSTTLASMIDRINKKRKAHIITIEDPIEFVHKDINCLINQRSIGQDATSFPTALRASLREDPDIILVGEIRDYETMNIALTAAETGHLVLSTLHTRDSQETVNRVLGMFSGIELERAKMALGSALQAIISQRLCQKIDGGRVPAVEVMLQTPRIKQLILKGRQDEILTAITEAGIHSGMQTFDSALLNLYKNKIITREEALNSSTTPNDLAILLEQASEASAQRGMREIGLKNLD
ncbi:MAG: PilT/PilU family type 4a pilus ATPase [Campylobacter sp.]|uniref:type IV pilus twitching motility protein PilT n=1 Tax=Campylobacter sp. TaxID=205 RepID=UPI002A766190|nr:PilT/PilU family type 4a pilus ATPase [Campylobacter sp.]MCI6344597.1 PilT/PilU family type 4a pilus ATPase [Campylobacter sp.]MDY3245513.1 PilT/PilU family type 4a pilus ATPase [Campylobacter sp.]MDY5114569.1 PilT/PilU family type 4a pilus ATPase [Campylobacter sp.]